MFEFVSRTLSVDSSAKFLKLTEMDVNLSSVNRLASKILVHLLGVDSLVVDVGLFVNIKAICFACNSLKERRTTTIACETSFS